MEVIEPVQSVTQSAYQDILLMCTCVRRDHQLILDSAVAISCVCHAGMCIRHGDGRSNAGTSFPLRLMDCLVGECYLVLSAGETERQPSPCNPCGLAQCKYEEQCCQRIICMLIRQVSFACASAPSLDDHVALAVAFQSGEHFVSSP
ncbi:hypothetical protein KIL84_002939 [Mauremys mutica]|uniref:Uncharacterized protein n=1 Tax=Mauremys mutica TaxID=74926 RepID=A0A9D3WUV0_9SAUR|nr:hypothetical protein KIL84_002939 [Mauremys mutica]